MLANPALLHFLHLYITFAGTIHALPQFRRHSPTGQTSAIGRTA
jgi:hypothetical protein